MSNTYIPALWVGGLLIVSSILTLVLIVIIACLRRAVTKLTERCEQYKASVGVNQRNSGGLVAAVQKRDDTIRKLELAAIRHVAQIEAAETRLVKEIAKQKALNHEIEDLKKTVARLRNEAIEELYPEGQ